MAGWHERLWVGIYKGVEVQEVKIVNWNVKSFVCMCEGWKGLKYWTKWYKFCSYLWHDTWEYFNYLCIECAT